MNRQVREPGSATVRRLLRVSEAAFWRSAGAASVACFATEDYGVLLPLDPDNLLRPWQTCESMGLLLWCGPELLDVPRDHFVADAIVSRRAAVRATDGSGFDVDLRLVMGGFDFETVWGERREFVVEGVPIPAASRRQIIRSKALLRRDKDRLVLATHADALEQVFPKDD